MQAVVVGENVGGKDNVVFTLHSPRFLEGYSFTEFGEGTPHTGGTSYALLTDLKVAIEEVNLDFGLSLPPVWLHYNAVTSHFKYYSERNPPPRSGRIDYLTDEESQGESPPGTRRSKKLGYETLAYAREWVPRCGGFDGFDRGCRSC